MEHEDELADRLKNVDGVAQSNVIGGLEEELQVIVDMERLAARQLTTTNLRDVLRAENKDTSAGDIWDGKNRYVVRLDGRFDTPPTPDTPPRVPSGRDTVTE